MEQPHIPNSVCIPITIAIDVLDLLATFSLMTFPKPVVTACHKNFLSFLAICEATQAWREPVDLIVNRVEMDLGPEFNPQVLVIEEANAASWFTEDAEASGHLNQQTVIDLKETLH